MTGCGHRRCALLRGAGIGLLAVAVGCIAAMAASRRAQFAAGFLTCGGFGWALLLAACPDPMPGQLPPKWKDIDAEWAAVNKELNR